MSKHYATAATAFAHFPDFFTKEKTYEDLKAKGVTFSQPPQKRPYGVEALLRDDSGNWFSMTERAR